MLEAVPPNSTAPQDVAHLGGAGLGRGAVQGKVGAKRVPERGSEQNDRRSQGTGPARLLTPTIRKASQSWT